jgi:hypothetical protein
VSTLPAISRQNLDRWFWPGLCVLLIPAALAAPSKPEWKPVAPADLAATAPLIEPDAPAEVIFWNIEQDDTDFPGERRFNNYVRFKVFAPDKAQGITRISGLVPSGSAAHLEDVDLRARLVLPDGSVKEFGKEAVRERSAAKSAAERSFLTRMVEGSDNGLNEKFLAISGVEPGAILEYRIAVRDRSRGLISFSGRILQLDGIPIRRLDYIHQVMHDLDYIPRPFLVNTNIGKAELKEDDGTRTITVVAQNVPALVHEPLSGGTYDSALALVETYSFRKLSLSNRQSLPRGLQIDPRKQGPWAETAGLYLLAEEDLTQPTKRVRQLAAAVTAGAAGPLDKARRIHRQVQGMYQQFRKQPNKSQQLRPYDTAVRSLDDILDFADRKGNLAISDFEFLWLAMSLYRTAGLETRLVLLPDRQVKRFNPRLVAGGFLNDKCASVLIDGQWRFSDPSLKEPLPFGQLPWYNEGQVGLLAQEGNQTFINVPFTPADQSVTVSSGTFQLSAEGDLNGECTQRRTGQEAAGLRTSLWDQTPQRQQEILKERLSDEHKGAEIVVSKVEGVEDPEAPVVATFTMRLPGFAVLTKDRLVLRPSAFRGQANSPFASAVRHNAVQFPYPWEEIDRLTVELPPGYEPESVVSPAPVQGADVLIWRARVSYEADKRLVHLQREFALGGVLFPVKQYAAVKGWFDAIDEGDQHELVFVRAKTKTATGGGGPSRGNQGSGE